MIEEELEIRDYDSRLMKRLLQYVRPYKRYVAAAFFLMLTGAGIRILMPYLVKVTIDSCVAPHDLAGLNNMAALYLLILLAELAVSYLQVYILQMTGQKIMYDMRTQIFQHIQKLQLSFFHKNPVGRLMTRVTNDVDVLNELFTSGVVAISGDILLLTGIIVAMLMINLQLALVTLSVVPLLFLVTYFFRKAARAAYLETRHWLARMNAFLQEAISGISIIKLFHQEKRMAQKFDQINHRHYQATMKSVMAYSVFYPAIEIIEAIAIALLVWYGGNRAIAGFATFGALIAFIQYTQMFFRPISDLSEKYNILQSAMASSEKIFNLLDNREMIQQPEQPVVIPERLRTIEFQNVSFQYRPDEPVLKNISFKIAEGEKVAIVGPTGAGKSTIIHLLLRFYDHYTGRILINGVDLRQISEEQIRKDMAVVFQDAFLFSRSVQENITLDRPNIDDPKVLSVSTYLLADPFIRRLPEGYKQILSERGSNLSFGQRQLLTFVRALVADPTIIILDEATSSVDVETEYVIRRSLKRLLANRTGILIAHRLSTIQSVDRILVILDGQIREQGTHQQLLSQKGLYYKLYQLQYKEQELAERAAEAD